MKRAFRGYKTYLNGANYGNNKIPRQTLQSRYVAGENDSAEKVCTYIEQNQ